MHGSACYRQGAGRLNTTSLRSVQAAAKRPKRPAAKATSGQERPAAKATKRPRDQAASSNERASFLHTIVERKHGDTLRAEKLSHIR